MFWKLSFVATCVLAAGAAGAAGAGRDLDFSVDAGVGRMDGTSYERVYTRIDHGPLSGREHRLSELIWDLEGIYGARVSAALDCDGRAEWRASVFSAFTEGSGGMVDYDWFLYDRPDFWTHRSRSTVDVENALDLDLRHTVRVVHTKPVSLAIMVGWRYLDFRWEDRGIDYDYSSLGASSGNPNEGYTYDQPDPGAVRDISGEDTRPGITYGQTFRIAYAGLGTEIRYDKLRLTMEVLYSPVATARDKDRHLLRNLLFEGTFTGGTYLAWKVALVHRFVPSLFLCASYESQTIDEFRGKMSVSEVGGSGDGTLYDGASVEHASQQATIAVGVNF